MIKSDGWIKYCIWENCTHAKELYARRCRLEEPEMDCAAQAADLLAPHVTPGDIFLDVGCGSGYFFHSLKKRQIPLEYFGIDASPSLIDIGRKCLASYGLPPENLQVMRIEDMDGAVDHITCINVLSNIDNYHRPLERMLLCARKTVIIRESVKKQAKYLYVQDKYLDPGKDLKVYVNAYGMQELMEFIESYGFKVRYVIDLHSKGKPQLVIGYPHYWKFFIAEKVKS